jgi:hypothetical protein
VQVRGSWKEVWLLESLVERMTAETGIGRKGPSEAREPELLVWYHLLADFNNNEMKVQVEF